VFGSWRTKLFLWQAEQGCRRIRRYPHDDPRTKVGEDVRVGVGVGVRVGAWNASLTPLSVKVNLMNTRHSVVADVES